MLAKTQGWTADTYAVVGVLSIVTQQLGDLSHGADTDDALRKGNVERHLKCELWGNKYTLIAKLVWLASCPAKSSVLSWKVGMRESSMRY
jgi:hypothetical protein